MSIGRDDDVVACQMYAEWPISSPYVTSVGATVLTNKYLPLCEQTYAPSDSFATLPKNNQLNVQCAMSWYGRDCLQLSEWWCDYFWRSSTIYNRAENAPWQQTVVDYYLNSDTSYPRTVYPPDVYSNSAGRGYPDVATYGSNYLIYLNGKTIIPMLPMISPSCKF